MFLPLPMYFLYLHMYFFIITNVIFTSTYLLFYFFIHVFHWCFFLSGSIQNWPFCNHIFYEYQYCWTKINAPFPVSYSWSVSEKASNYSFVRFNEKVWKVKSHYSLKYSFFCSFSGLRDFSVCFLLAKSWKKSILNKLFQHYQCPYSRD